ncbi:MAG: MFS transporter [Alphaproteobacteria bacterium]|nr:MFS transporter [Alphaproteobacteria bacterium]
MSEQSGEAPRRIALGLLGTVLDRAAPLAEGLESNAELRALAPRDRAFARLLALTVLRRLGQLDGLIAHALARPLGEHQRVVTHALRLGLTQLLLLDTPAHAAIHTSVGLVRAAGLPGMTGLVNAVLRRLAREGPALFAAQDAPRLNTPDWLWQNWSRQFGADTARRIASAHLGEPPLDLTVPSDPRGWAARLGAEVLPTGSLRLAAAGPVADLPGYSEGAWWVQDAAAALPVRLLGPIAGVRVLDLCAAPGGKTAQLAALGAEVIAVDRSADRLARLGENLRRLCLKATLVEADVLSWRPPRPFPMVLLDAPCTATGTIRRHPDIARLKTAADPARLAHLQRRLLDAAADCVAPGGLLLYITCSLEDAECRDLIDGWLAIHPAFARSPVPLSDVAGEADFITPSGDLRTLPCHWPEQGGLDGFYAARLSRGP